MPKTKEIVRQIFKPLANRGLILIRLARSNLMLTRRAAFMRTDTPRLGHRTAR